jgi:hypothetical protein
MLVLLEEGKQLPLLAQSLRSPFFFSKVFGTTRGGEMIVATPPGGLLRESDLG